jgi:type I restriction enzyme S subunit
LGTRALQDIRLPIPSVDVQENVAAVLDPIDDKATHCLHRARQLLKLSRALALRARSAATGEAPLEAFAVVLGGGTPPTGDRALWDGEHAWATPKDLTALQVPYLGKTARTLTDAGLGMSTLAPAGSILLSSRATIGAVTLTSAPTAFNQGCTAVVPMRGELTHYLFHELDARVPEIESLANGTTFLEVGKRSLRGLLIPELEAREMRRLSRTLCVLHERAQALAIEARKLEALRDGLAQRLFTVV